MEKTVSMKTTTLIALGLLTGAAASNAAVLYDNTSSPGTTTYGPGFNLPLGTVFGDQIQLASPDPANTVSYILSSFAFEYSATGLNGGEQVILRFYENDGPVNQQGVPSPGELFFTAPAFGIENTGVAGGDLGGASLTYTLAGVIAPDIFTWTVEFVGLDAGEAAGLNVYTPPAIGGNIDSYWVRRDGLWGAEVDPTGAAVDFGAIADGSLVIVPEPGSIAIFGLGALALLGFHRRFKFNR